MERKWRGKGKREEEGEVGHSEPGAKGNNETGSLSIVCYNSRVTIGLCTYPSSGVRLGTVLNFSFRSVSSQKTNPS